MDTGTGIVSYFSKDGKVLLAEKSGMQFIDFDDAGTKTYQVYQPVVLDKDCLLYTSGNISPRDCALIEPMSVGFHAVSRAQVIDNEYVMVIGCGMIGIGAIVRAARCV